MAVASIAKRIRLTERVIRKAKGTKKTRFIGKLAFLKGADPRVKFQKGSKTKFEGGYQ